MSELTHSAAQNQKELENLLEGILADLSALKTAADASKIATDELIDDHATFKTVVTDAKTLANDLRAKVLGDFVDGATGLAIGSDDAAKVLHGAFEYHINGQEYSVAAGEVVLSGEAIPDAKAGAFALEINAAGTISIVEATGNATGYATAEAALAGLPAQSADKARLGTVTVVNNGAIFTPGTTELSAVTVTDAYADATPLLTTIGSAVSTSAPATLTASKPTAVGTLATTNAVAND